VSTKRSRPRSPLPRRYDDAERRGDEASADTQRVEGPHDQNDQNGPADPSARTVETDVSQESRGGATLHDAVPDATQSITGTGEAGGDSSVIRTFRSDRTRPSRARRALGFVPHAAYRRVHRMTHGRGAGESGLAHVMELHAVSSAADMMITLSLANSLFFSVKPGEARSKVALYLVITMIPFVLLAPVIGPLLDRLRGGRRYAMAATTLARAVLAVVLAQTLRHDPLAAYPAAFGCLAASKAYGVSRSAVMPRVLPRGTTLVQANSRATMASIVATAIAAPIGGGLTKLGLSWGLAFAALLFGLATVLALRLPSRVDDAGGEQRAQFKKRDKNLDPRLAATMPNLRLRSVGPAVLLALRTNAALRGFSGFLTIFLAFLLRSHPVDHLGPLFAIAAAGAAAYAGNALGTALGSWVKGRAPEAIATTTITLTTVVGLITALYFRLPTVLAVAAAIALAQGWGKLALDALLQRDTLEAVRTSAFARSETILQLCYVLGGLLGIALPPNGPMGIGIASAVLAVFCLLSIRSLIDLHRRHPYREHKRAEAG
jgi:MFS family permease